MEERFGNLASMPSFLSESTLWNGLFSPKARLTLGPMRENARRYLGSHRYGIKAGIKSFDPISDSKRLVIEIYLSILERGEWTLPSWRLESKLATLASEELDWNIEPASNASGELRLKQTTLTDSIRLKNILLPSPLDSEFSKEQAIAALAGKIDKSSPGESLFLHEIAAPILPLPYMCMLSPQRQLSSMGLDQRIFKDQCVDFALETPQGDRLVIEIDGGQHESIAGQNILDNERDSALIQHGWNVWRISTNELNELESLRVTLHAKLQEFKSKISEDTRDNEIVNVLWSSTVASRTQALILEAILNSAVPNTGTLRVLAIEHETDIAEEAIADLNDAVSRLSKLYGISDLPIIKSAGSDSPDLIVDVHALNPLYPISESDCTVAWSRPACRSVPLTARRIKVLRGTPKFIKEVNDLNILDEFVRDLFRKDGFRRDEIGRSDQAEIACRILMGKDVVGLLPTGAGKSLPYMLAGLLLPGLTLYVAPLVSLLQDQTERLKELGIDHIELISGALNAIERQTALDNAQNYGIKFLLVAPERFLVRGFEEALNRRSLWQGAISQVVIDECHCVSEWGHEFRPAYLSLGRIARNRNRIATDAPLVGLTGTASTIVLSDVLRELGILDHDACIRASHLDRPEISMKCTQIHNQNNREQHIENSVIEFIGENANQTDGVLIFCPFKGGRSIGVFSVASHLMRTLPEIDVRFYSGGDAPWKDFAVFRQMKRKDQLTNQDIISATPEWALTSERMTKDWSAVKSEVQRNFISGTRSNFRVLVATKAFGMGIDKPSIRKIIHVVSPTSPEAFYQEIGRAGRDRKQSESELFFCDIEPEVTDSLLNPSTSQPEAQNLYNNFKEKNPYGGGDFLKTYFFQNKSFSDREEAASDIFETAIKLQNLLKNSEDTVIPFRFIPNEEDSPRLEYAIVRLVHLGVVDRYYKDYNRNVFEINLIGEWVNINSDPEKLSVYLSNQFESFIKRYQLSIDRTGIERIAREKSDIASLYKAVSSELMNFIYEQIERQRRQATRQMLELARVGANDSSLMRERLLNYLQVSLRFTGILETLDVKSHPSEWIEILYQASSPQDLSELHGAAQRILESYPTHPGLLFITSISRTILTETDLKRSQEELTACINFVKLSSIDTIDLINAFESIKQKSFLGNTKIEPMIQTEMGLLYLAAGPIFGNVRNYLKISKVRHQWLSKIVNKTAIDSRIYKEPLL